MSGIPSLKPLDLLDISKKLVVACYELTAKLPPEEKTNLIFYLRNTSLKVHTTSIEAAFTKKKKKKEKLIEEAKNGLVVIDAVIEVLLEVELARQNETTEVMRLSSALYQLLDHLKTRK